MSFSAPQAIIRGRFLDIQSLVNQADQIAEHVRYLEDGVMLIEQGKIVAFDHWENLKDHLPAHIEITHYH